MPTILREGLSSDDQNDFSEWLDTDPDIPLNQDYLEHWLIEVEGRDVKSTTQLKEEARRNANTFKPVPEKIVKEAHRDWRVIGKYNGEIYEAGSLSDCKNRFDIEEIHKLESGVYEVLDIFEVPDNIGEATYIQKVPENYWWELRTEDDETILKMKNLSDLLKRFNITDYEKRGDRVEIHEMNGYKQTT